MRVKETVRINNSSIPSVGIKTSPTDTGVEIEITDPENKSFSVEIINISGSVIFKKTAYIPQIDLSNFPGGKYFVKIKLDKEILIGELKLP